MPIHRGARGIGSAGSYAASRRQAPMRDVACMAARSGV